MKMIQRIFLLTLVIGTVFGGNVYSKTQTTVLIPSIVPGGGGPMPICDPFKNPNCPSIR